MENNNTNKKTKWLKRIGFIAFAIFCGAAITGTALEEFGPASKAEKVPLDSINLNYLFLALASILIAIFAESMKYYIMIRDVTGGKKMPGLAYKTAIYGKYYDNITPFAAGGQPFQIYTLQKNGIPIGDAAALPIAGFICNQVAFVAMALVMFIVRGNVTRMTGFRIAAYVGLLFYLFIPVLLLLFAFFPDFVMHIIRFFVRAGAKLRIVKDEKAASEKIRGALIEYQTSLKKITKNKETFISVLGMSLLYQFALMIIPYFVLIAFGKDAELMKWYDVLAMVLLVYASVTIVPTPGNSGAAEGAFYVLFQSLSKANLFWAMLVWRFFVYYFVIILGLATSGYEKIHAKLIKRKNKKTP